MSTTNFDLMMRFQPSIVKKNNEKPKNQKNLQGSAEMNAYTHIGTCNAKNSVMPGNASRVP